MISLRRAVEGDMPDITAIERECIAPPWSEGSLSREVHGGNTFFCVSLENGVVIGFVILRRADDEGEIFQIAVTAKARGSGAADMLLSAAMRWADDSGLVCVYLEVRVSNAPAVGLYLKHGFTIVGRRKKYYTEPAEDAYVMSRRLKDDNIVS